MFIMHISAIFVALFAAVVPAVALPSPTRANERSTRRASDGLVTGSTRLVSPPARLRLPNDAAGLIPRSGITRDSQYTSDLFAAAAFFGDEGVRAFSSRWPSAFFLRT